MTTATGMRLPPDWMAALEHRSLTPTRVNDLLTRCYEDENERTLPRREDVFSAFWLTRLDDVRVVILGQDPYPNRGQAHGLAFSVANEERPRSLLSIFKNLETDPAIVFTPPTSGNLSTWAEQGVLLLNTALTVREGSAGSHRQHWKEFTTFVLKTITEERPDTVFLLWGNDAIKAVESIPIAPANQICCSHPVAWGRTRYPRFSDARPFSEANSHLARTGYRPISWRLA